MDTQTETQTNTKRTFDHVAIKADLAANMPVKAIAEKHGCSESLVQNIRYSNGDKASNPPNARRAIAARKKAEQMSRDVDLLTKWLSNEANIEATPEGDKYTGVTDLLTAVQDVRAQLEIVAELYEALPDDAMKTKRGHSRPEFEPGTVVSVKAAVAETYAAICSSPDHLTVVMKRDSHVMVMDDQGSKFFAHAKDLKLRSDA